MSYFPSTVKFVDLHNFYINNKIISIIYIMSCVMLAILLDVLFKIINLYVKDTFALKSWSPFVIGPDS